MRCAEVARELSAPTGALAPDAIARHLAACPECAGWAGRVERLDQIWEATRPPVPAESWDSVWAKVSQAQPATPTRWRVRPILIGVAIAQAAALLIAALILFPRGHSQPAVTLQPVPASVPPHNPLHGFEANQGEILTLHIEGRHQVRVDRRPEEEGVSANDTVAWVHDLYNGIEVIASISP